MIESVIARAMLALVARNMRWVRQTDSRFTSVQGRTGSNFDDVIATYNEGETLTRLTFGYQMVWSAPHLPEWPWNQIAMLGFIPVTSIFSAPPERPLSDPNADWVWREPVIFDDSSRQLDSSNDLLLNKVSAGVAQRTSHAQRLGFLGPTTNLWAVMQWSIELPANDAVFVRLNTWTSVGILEP